MSMNNITPWKKMEIIRHKNRPTIRDYLPMIFEDFYEMHGDRLYGDDGAIIGGIGRLRGMPVTIIAEVKGRDLNENKQSNFAMPHPEGYRKALRLAKQAEKFKRPVICFIDTPGAFCGIEAEKRGQGEAIARNLFEFMTLKTPVVSVVLGEGGSGGALALAVADRVWMLENAVYSVISPEGCASILWKDAKQAETAAASLKLTAKDALRFGVIERILPEKDMGKQPFYDRIAAALKTELDALSRDPDLIAKRYARFRGLGAVEESK